VFGTKIGILFSFETNETHRNETIHKITFLLSLFTFFIAKKVTKNLVSIEVVQRYRNFWTNPTERVET